MGEVDENTSYQEVDDVSKPSLKPTKEEPIVRKVICRYGCGCTHLMDAAHREKFWHPKVQRLDEDKIKSHFICNECGYATGSLTDLQLHLKRKTAWSNNSLVGCRINCLVDCKEWHEGFVVQFHKSGKHLVEFRVLSEKRWLVMKKVAFYIVERPPQQQSNDGGEYKENSAGEQENLAPLDENWVFCEDISLEYAFAQSVLFKIYGNSLQETGHLTRGHVSLTESDRVNAMSVKSSLLYGELLPRGANKALGGRRLEAYRAQSLFDLGMGTGKIVIQAFLQYRNLKYCFGVELSQGRYKLAEEAAIRMVQLLGTENYNVQMNPGKFIIVTEAVRLPSQNNHQRPDEIQFSERVLHFQCGNMFDTLNIETADIVMMETDIPLELYPNLHRMVCNLHEGARMLSYIDFRRLCDIAPVPLKQLEINRHLSDRYPTSWSVQRGHHFFLWQKTSFPENSSWSNNLALGLGFVSHDLSNGSLNISTQVNKPASPSGGSYFSRDNSFTSSQDDEIDGARCIPFPIRFPFNFNFGWGNNNNKRKQSLNRGKVSEEVMQQPVSLSNDRTVIPVNASGQRSTPLPTTSSSNQNSPAKSNAQQTRTPVDPAKVSPSRSRSNSPRLEGQTNPAPSSSSSRKENNISPMKSNKIPINGNLIIQGGAGDDLLNDYRGDQNNTSNHHFSPIQGSPIPGGGAVTNETESFAGNAPATQTVASLQFPPDIRSRMRSSPTGNNNNSSTSQKTSKKQKHSPRRPAEDGQQQSPRTVKHAESNSSLDDQSNLSKNESSQPAPVNASAAAVASATSSSSRGAGNTHSTHSPAKVSSSAEMNNNSNSNNNLSQQQQRGGRHSPEPSVASSSKKKKNNDSAHHGRNSPTGNPGGGGGSGGGVGQQNIHNQQYQTMMSNPPPSTYQIPPNGKGAEGTCIIS